MMVDIGHEPRLEPSDDESKAPICPVCGFGCDTLYRDGCVDIVGCDQCLDACDAWDYYKKL